MATILLWICVGCGFVVSCVEKLSKSEQQTSRLSVRRKLKRKNYDNVFDISLFVKAIVDQHRFPSNPKYWKQRI